MSDEMTAVTPKKPKRNTTKETEAAAAVTGKKWCLDHQGYANANNGTILQRNNSWRWVCLPCQQRRETALAARRNK